MPKSFNNNNNNNNKKKKKKNNNNNNLLFVLFFSMYMADSYNLVVVIYRIKLIIS